MADTTATTFEAKLAKLEEIVRLLEGDAVSLEDSVTLFNDGRRLAQECEAMLKAAHDAIEAPNPPGAPAPAAGANGSGGSLFDDDALT